MSLKTVIRVLVETTQTSEADGGPRTGAHKYDSGEVRWTDGIGYDQNDLVYSDTRTLPSSTEDIDLVGSGTFTDAFGATVTMAKIKAIILLNTSTSLTLTCKPKTTTGWLGMLAADSDILNVAPASSQMYGLNLWCAPKGVAITAGTDLLTIGGTAGQIYKIIVIGTSA